MALVTQIKDIVNDSVHDALGKNAGTTQIETSDIVSLGKALSTFDAFEGFYKSLANRIVRTIYFVRTYETKTRSVMRDEHEYGAFVQKVYYTMPDAVDNASFAIPDSTGNYKQQSPYDVENVVAVSALVYGGQGTWTIEIIRPEDQIKSAFDSESAMMSFIDGIYLTVENAFKLEEERLVALAVNTSIADSINSGKARNLLKEYNTAHTDATLKAANCMENAAFLKYASMEINRTVDNMGEMTTVFNAEGYNTFTNKENLVVEMLSQFASASEMYLQSDTFHDELVKLPRFEKVPFWQSSGKSFAFADCSTVNIKHDDLVTATNTTGVVKQSGIICFMHDVENVACYFGNRRTWELWNPRSEVMVHGEKARKGYAVDRYANAYVFYVADSE